MLRHGALCQLLDGKEVGSGLSNIVPPGLRLPLLPYQTPALLPQHYVSLAARLRSREQPALRVPKVDLYDVNAFF